MTPPLTPQAIKLLRYWQGVGARLNPGASDESLAALASYIGHRLPEPMLVFYSWANGMEDWTSDGSMFSLWPIERILREHSRAGVASPTSHPPVLPFADFLIDSHWYSVVLQGRRPARSSRT